MASLEELRRIRARLHTNLVECEAAKETIRWRSVPSVIMEIEKYLEQDARRWLALSDIAFILGFEPTYCSKAFQSHTGKSFTRWNREIRIRIAQTLLRHTDAKISDIGSAVGYANLTTFERNFRKVEGVSPRQFRRYLS
jgi:two-component system, response regulator YesN